MSSSSFLARSNYVNGNVWSQMHGCNLSRLKPWASECPDVKNYKWQLNQVLHRMLISVPMWQQWASKG